MHDRLTAPILPPGVRSVERRGDNDPDTTMLPAEEAALGQVAPGRRGEFAAGRACARRALAALGLPATPIGRGPRGEPLWPDGVVGSISHCPGLVVAAVARREDFLSIGIDVEPDEELPSGIVDSIALAEEISWLRSTPRVQALDRLLFSVKESVYKAWFPVTGEWLGFEEVHVRFDLEEDAFTARLQKPGTRPDGERLGLLRGRFRIAEGLILSFVSLER